MLATEKENGYDYYAENIARVIIDHGLLVPDEEAAFINFVRGV
ncbi:MAG: hypothetical protein ABIC91_06590 [Nanoarchaeota archaeon]